MLSFEFLHILLQVTPLRAELIFGWTFHKKIKECKGQ